jgi:hypothetical protein
MRGRALSATGVLVILVTLLTASASGQILAPSDPVITSHPPSLTNSTSATFEFSSDPTAVGFECKLDTVLDFSECASGDAYTDLPEGDRTFELKAVDLLGEESGVTSYSWTIDLTPPSTTIDGAPEDPSNDSSPTFAFSSEATSSLECTLDGSETDCTSPYTYPSVSDGSHTFVVTATDAAGNVDPNPPTYTWTIDLVPPPTPTIASGPSGVVDSSTASFEFEDSESGIAFVCTLDGQPEECPTFSGLGDGLHTLDVLARDSAGNESLPATRTWTVDATPPNPSVTSPAAGSATADQTPQLLGTADTGPADADAVTLELYAGSSPTGTPLETFSPLVSAGSWSAVPSSELAAGTYTVQVMQSDSFDRTGTSSPRTFRVDLTAPTVSLTRPLNGTLTNNPTPTYRGAAGTADGDLPEVTVEVHSGGTASGPMVASLTATPASDGTWSVAQPTDLTDGKYAALAKQMDSAGSTGTSTVHVFTLDTTAPSALASATIRAGYGAVTIGWQRGGDWKTSDMLAIYRRVAGASTRRLKIKTAASSWKDKNVENGVTYQYDLVPIDRAGNRAPALSKNARPSGFRTPRNGAVLTAPIGISWIDVPNSTYSNIQVWNGGLTRKMLSVWPKGSSYTLRSRWTYRGNEYRLRHGHTYRIYGWPGFGAVSNGNYGESYGWVQFTFH